MDEPELQSICPKLRQFVAEVLSARPGVIPHPIRIRNLKSSQNSAALSSGAPMNDRFTLVIPYCERQLKWDVIFLCDHPEFPPDFYFNDCNFLEDADCHFIQRTFPSLANWDHNDPKSLLNVITEFVSFYKIYQLNLIPSNHRAYSEMGMLLEESAMPLDVELIKEADSISALVCIIQLDDDFKIVASLNFDLRYDKVKSNLKAYGKSRFWDPSDNLDLPPFSSSKSIVLDFLPEMKQKAEDILSSKLKRIARRKQLILQFYVAFKHNIVEFDAIGFTYALFHLYRDNFQFFVKVTLNNFPDREPQYRLISNYCFKDLMFYERVEFPITNVKYTPHMSMHDVVTNFFYRFHEVFNNHRKSCIALLPKNIDSLRM